MKKLDSIYLDYAAATPLDDVVLEAMKPFQAGTFYNPSALYSGAREAKTALEDARSRVSHVLGVKPSEITFVSGGTESDNLAINGVASAYPDSTIIISAVEHDAVRVPALKRTGTKLAPVDPTGRVDVTKLIELVDDTTVLISVMYVNNEVGTIQPLKEICEAVERIRQVRAQRGVKRPLWVHTDACQAPLYLDVSVSKLGVDLMTLNGGKIFGPKQSGVLYHRSGVKIEPILYGGGQELGLRSGTENVASCVGFSVALEHATESRHEAQKHAEALAQHFRTAISSIAPDCIFNGHKKLRIPCTIHVTFPSKDNERIIFALDDRGVFAASGSACSASKDETSHVLRAMGISESDARASIRFTIGKHTTLKQLDRAIESLKEALVA